jgi:ribosomal protein S27AE
LLVDSSSFFPLPSVVGTSEGSSGTQVTPTELACSQCGEVYVMHPKVAEHKNRPYLGPCCDPLNVAPWGAARFG